MELAAFRSSKIGELVCKGCGDTRNSDEISALEQRRNKTNDLKQAMMQELLTVHTRLVSPEVTHA
jgi:predicted Fe-S protein YdhL (DUF1289 family)